MSYVSKFVEYISFPRDANGAIIWTSCDALPGLAFWAFSSYILLRFIAKSFQPRGVRIAGSTFLITGASSGIGEALAKQIVKRGGKVALVARNMDALTKLQNELNSAFPGSTLVFQADCSKPEDVDRFSEQVKQKLDIPHVIVNCAGAGRWRYLYEMDGEEIKSCMDAPFFAAALVSRAFLPGLLERRSGSIVNVQSPAGWAPWGGSTAYACTRFALRGLSYSLRSDLVGTGVNVQEVLLTETTSNYFTVNADSHERLPKIAALIGTLTPAEAASSVIKSIESGAFLTAYPLRLSLLMSLYGYIPSIIDRAIWFTGWTVEKSKNNERQQIQSQQHKKQK